MTVKEVEEQLNSYIKNSVIQEHKKKALEEFGKVQEKIPLSDLTHIGFIISDYPEYDHFLFKLTDNKNNIFFRIGFNRDYLKSLKKKDIHEIAKWFCSTFGEVKLAKEEEKHESD